jgi:hypothetical protein
MPTSMTMRTIFVLVKCFEPLMYLDRDVVCQGAKS